MWVLYAVVLVMLNLSPRGSAAVLYSTGFEPAEGFDPNFTLAGQGGWNVEGSGGNGLVTNFFSDFGQSAFIGFEAPTTTDQSTTLWTPLNIDPVPPAASILKFSVTIDLLASTTGGDDEFRWAVYNQQVNRLFSIDFFMPTLEIYYDLEDQQPYDAGFSFEPDGQYDLDVYMDFGRNQWMALLNDYVIINAQPIALTNSTPLNLGDIDAVWYINDPQSPGDNYMVFDNYALSTVDSPVIPPVLEDLGLTEQGTYNFLVHGEIGVNYSVDVSSDFQTWTTIGTYPDTDGTFLFEDTTSTNYPTGFYRIVAEP
jgi:hypothetical protein